MINPLVSFCYSAEEPSDEDTIWKYEGEDMTSACPGYVHGSSKNHGVVFSWFGQEYDCKGMNQSIAYYDKSLGKIT